MDLSACIHTALANCTTSSSSMPGETEWELLNDPSLTGELNGDPASDEYGQKVRGCFTLWGCSWSWTWSQSQLEPRSDYTQSYT